MSQVNFINMVSQVVRTKRPFDNERAKQIFKNCFQWSYAEQIYSFQHFSYSLLAIEMSGICLAWYDGFSIRQQIQMLHDKYHRQKLEMIEDNLLNDLWCFYDSTVAISLTVYLDKVYGRPHHNSMQADKNDLLIFGQEAFHTYRLSTQYNMFADMGDCIYKYRGLDDEI